MEEQCSNIKVLEQEIQINQLKTQDGESRIQLLTQENESLRNILEQRATED